MDELDEMTGANAMTLREARANFKKFGAAKERSLKSVMAPEERSQFKRIERNIRDTQ